MNLSEFWLPCSKDRVWVGSKTVFASWLFHRKGRESYLLNLSPFREAVISSLSDVQVLPLGIMGCILSMHHFLSIKFRMVESFVAALHMSLLRYFPGLGSITKQGIKYSINNKEPVVYRELAHTWHNCMESSLLPNLMAQVYCQMCHCPNLEKLSLPEGPSLARLSETL